MGYTFEVDVWDGPAGGEFKWLSLYRGRSMMRSLYYLWWAKRQGWKCIKLEWRP